MNVGQSLICFFFLTLQDGNIGLINAEIIQRTGTEGGDITIKCTFSIFGNTKIFCKDECEDGDILIETEKDTDHRGRYSIEYIKISTFSYVLYVSIRNLTQSDSGRYRWGLVRSFSSSYCEIELRVPEAPTSPPRPSPPSVPSSSTLMTSQSFSSTPSSSSSPSSSSPEASEPRKKHPASGMKQLVGRSISGRVDVHMDDCVLGHCPLRVFCNNGDGVSQTPLQ
ncbi:CMRF35-like molecule 9 [Etheostoma spectabile]|uniref:CMRF35-like molecule 9 n=1 Tax=Etheostoma spectabile TaxID=54343 RepID=UPI0013AF3A6F|nr:CMRF35-like molecule 9 [Etheostoma spectabile]